MLSYSLRSILFMICFVYGSYAETKPVWLSAILPVTYTNWKPIQPRYNQDNVLERCIEALSYYKKKTNDLTWNDAFCNEKCNFICESRDDNQCTSNSTSNTSFYIGHERVSHKTAIAKCAARGQMLVSIHNEAKQKAIDNFLKNTDRRHSLWTSGNKIADKKTWRWLSGEVFKYTLWQKWDPNNYGSGKECLVMSNRDSNNAVWYDVSCARKYFYLCECNRFTSSDCGQDIIGLPNEKLEEHQDKYYLSTDKLSYYDALGICQGKDMKLVSIQTDRKNKEMFRLLNGTTDHYWTSGNRLSDKVNWFWLKGEIIEFTNWRENEPNNKQSDEYCIEVFRSENEVLWNDEPCQDNRPFICEKLSVEDEFPLCDDYSDELVTGNTILNKKYFIGRERITYSKALQVCRSMCMRLVSLENETQNQNLFEALIHTDRVVFWSSAHFKPNNSWEWGNGQIATFFNWNDGEPNNSRGNEYCIDILKLAAKMVWNDQPCEDKRMYVCESIEDGDLVETN